ncbi:hypothetical protein RYH80_20115, partial [Halobaculum sp. MBLA0147]|uniref:hypothetical protein n=1 Tax=Halobaculum sp. MBLA0147 TaxID=3079934 RepID=UPI00352434D5
MRLFIYADAGSKPPFHLPWNYHLSFQAFVYDALDRHRPELADEYHERDTAPPFSFSEFIQTASVTTSDSGIACRSGFWVFNAEDTALIDAVANHARGDELTLGHTTVPVDGVEVEQIESVTQARYRTLSPIFSTIHRDGDRVPLHPDDPMWGHRLHESVRDRMTSREYDTSAFQFDLEATHGWEEDGMRVNSDHIRSCTHTEFTLRTDELTSRFVQRQGIAEGSGLGLSTVIPVDHLPEAAR